MSQVPIMDQTTDLDKVSVIEATAVYREAVYAIRLAYRAHRLTWIAHTLMLNELDDAYFAVTSNAEAATVAQRALTEAQQLMEVAE